VSVAARTRQSGAVSIIDLSGRITLGEGCAVLRDTVRDLLAKGNKKIVLNMGEVTYVDSAGLGELVGSHATVSHQDGQLRLLNLQKKIRDLMQITKLHTIFEVFEDEDAAVKSFT
jgi:anti-sigma B factor antagonist